MAGLLYLHEYQHARHLWRRSSTSTTAAPATTVAEDPEYYQLKLLWSAAKHMITGNSKSAFVGLNMCISSNLQPLSSHALEVKEKYRTEMMELMEQSYIKISWTDCCDKLGVVHKNDKEVQELVVCLEKRGWDVSGVSVVGKSECYVSPPKGGYVVDEDSEDEMEVAEDIHKQKRDDKIQSLTEIVAFMECRRTNA
mmetsp:Transcript_25314/g.33695  ORF Transcript_25314/g.33695 Transcript_25314/m.33695 type:complete len:196 (+) Transcript_25314:497-1084(+)